MTPDTLPFAQEQARAYFRTPGPSDDKYRRGVVGVVAGSDTYPGAGLLASFAAAQTGVGMVRLNAPRRVEDLVLAHVPGVVTVGGRIQAGLVGPGCDTDRREDCVELARFCIDSKLPLVIDAGALDEVAGLVAYGKERGRSLSRTILTPHHGEAARLLSQLGEETTRAKIDADPLGAARALVELTDAVVVFMASTARGNAASPPSKSPWKLRGQESPEAETCSPGLSREPWPRTKPAWNAAVRVRPFPRSSVASVRERESGFIRGQGRRPAWVRTRVSVPFKPSILPAKFQIS